MSYDGPNGEHQKKAGNVLHTVVSIQENVPFCGRLYHRLNYIDVKKSTPKVEWLYIHIDARILWFHVLYLIIVVSSIHHASPSLSQFQSQAMQQHTKLQEP
jgi:hypothetical protein